MKKEILKTALIILAIFGGTYLFTYDFKVSNDCPEKVDFRTVSIRINSKPYDFKLATSKCQLSQGLMDMSLDQIQNGMIFAFPVSSKWAFWMKNTPVDLDIAFVSENLEIVSIQEMKKESKPDFLMTNYKPDQDVKYAIEVPKDFFKLNNIKVGDKISLKGEQ